MVNVELCLQNSIAYTDTTVLQRYCEIDNGLTDYEYLRNWSFYDYQLTHFMQTLIVFQYIVERRDFLREKSIMAHFKF